jgi:putative transposase
MTKLKYTPEIRERAVYTAFIIDVFSRAIVGWKVSTRMNTDMVLDALEQALHDRGMPKNVIHHSDRGVQYLSIRYTNRLEAANLRASVGTTGDSCSGLHLKPLRPAFNAI